MLKHADIWRAIDQLARMNDLSPSALAKQGGLDPTTFNRSKRFTAHGRPRWPSTESVSKILNATGATISEFTALIGPSPGPGDQQRIPIIGYAQAGADGFFDDAGYPAGKGWDEVIFPDLGDPHAYALEVTGDSMEPAYRDGTVIIVSPSAGLRRGDRVVLRTSGGEVMAKELVRQTADRIDLRSINPDHPDRSIDLPDVAWKARIIWASQ